jgi:RsiW-degrading membrane proteinase PrsW (M82 family)
MGLNGFLLLCAALFPAIALCIYVFKKDRVEKEPMGLLLSLFFLGMVICFPAAEIENVLLGFIDSVFLPFGVEVGGEVVLNNAVYQTYIVCQNFIGIARVEEGLKLLILLWRTSKNKNFNSLFDGVVYAVFVSLGFAALENILYVRQYGWMNALMRGILAVPGHTFFGVLMGYYYSLWHMYEKAGERELQLKQAGLAGNLQKTFSGKRYLALSLLIPTLAHGMYDFSCTSNSLSLHYCFTDSYFK